MVFYRRGPFEGYARCKPDFPPMDMIDPITPPIYQPFPQAVLFPFLFFFGTSVIESAGGKLCFNLSAFSESFNTSVYMNREHRTLNLIWWGLRFMCPDLASFRRQISMNCLISETSRGIVGKSVADYRNGELSIARCWKYS